jgi:hypothetical protein
MNEAQIRALIDKKVIKKQAKNEYRLKRPLEIQIKKSVIDNLYKIYKPDFEEGGILVADALNQKIIIYDFIQVKNLAKVPYSYIPNPLEFSEAVDSVLGDNKLPFAIHTHPIKLNIESYDNKRNRFYLKSSRSDRQIAREGINDFFNFPEAIFTVFENGNFGINFYTGTIFPYSISALSTLQIGSLIAGLGAWLYNKKLIVPGISSALFLSEFFRRPQYTLLANGDVLISLKA